MIGLRPDRVMDKEQVWSPATLLAMLASHTPINVILARTGKPVKNKGRQHLPALSSKCDKRNR